MNQNDAFKLHKLDSGPSCEVDITRDQMVKMYTQMTEIKEMETKADQMYGQKIIRGFLHLYLGQVGREGVGIKGSGGREGGRG